MGNPPVVDNLSEGDRELAEDLDVGVVFVEGTRQILSQNRPWLPEVVSQAVATPSGIAC